MEIKLEQGPLAGIAADTLVVIGFSDAPDPDLNGSTGGWINELYASKEFTGKPFELALLHKPAGLKAKRLAIVGAGDAAKFDGTQARKVVGAAVRLLKARSLRNLHISGRGFISESVEGAILGDYEPDQLKTDPKKVDKRLESLTIVAPSDHTTAENEVLRGRIIAESQNFARDLKNEPANRLTPLALAEHARGMAKETGLEVEILSEDQMKDLGMGALIGVAMGSDNPPALIILRYIPKNASSSDHLGLVGKGVTFDTGGISIKPADGMEKMKYDMGGGASVIGAMRALAYLKPPVRITALIPTVENMINGHAQRPGDIVTSLAGKTVEVLNTDAEGRLILIDALSYAIRLGCTHLVDAATLTGAIVVALGHLHVGAFSNNDALWSQVSAASKMTGERMWQMPLDDDYKDYLKSSFADLANIGGRWGGAITAAKFLEEFVENKPWVHLDIAGTAWLDEGTAWMAKGPSGVPVRTFIELAMNWKASS
jgi:leucyl aminopeptidase